MIKFRSSKIHEVPEQDDQQMHDGLNHILKASLFHVSFPQNKTEKEKFDF